MAFTSSQLAWQFDLKYCGSFVVKQWGLDTSARLNFWRGFWTTTSKWKPHHGGGGEGGGKTAHGNRPFRPYHLYCRWIANLRSLLPSYCRDSFQQPVIFAWVKKYIRVVCVQQSQARGGGLPYLSCLLHTSYCFFVFCFPISCFLKSEKPCQIFVYYQCFFFSSTWFTKTCFPFFSACRGNRGMAMWLYSPWLCAPIICIIKSIKNIEHQNKIVLMLIICGKIFIT